MNETKLLIGSLSNDLQRVAVSIHRGSYPTAERFLKEANRWVLDLEEYPVKEYIQKILTDLKKNRPKNIKSLEIAEKYLMYSILLQNYALHLPQ